MKFEFNYGAYISGKFAQFSLLPNITFAVITEDFNIILDWLFWYIEFRWYPNIEEDENNLNETNY